MQDSTYTRKQTKKFWGACDGQSIYINELMYGSKFILKKIGGLGRYCYFKGTPPYNSSYMAVGLMGGAIGGAIAGAANALQADEPYVININNGKAFLLNKETLRLILKKDKGLLDLYEDEARKASNELMLSYIKQYNVRHVEEISINSWAPIDVAFYRRSKKESDVPFNVLVNENDTLVMETNSIYRFKSWSDTLTACIGNRCQEIVLTKRKINYLQAAWKLNESLPEVKKVNIKEGEFYSKEIEFNVVKKNK